MKDQIVMTENVLRFANMVESLKNKPGRSDKMGLAYGQWGLGKSTSIEWYFTNKPCVYVRAKAGWRRSLNMMVEDILGAYRVKARGRLKHDLRELERITHKNRVPLFIDEADRVIRTSILVETIRDIHDLSKIPIILVGQEEALSMLQRRDLGQVLSRISEVVEFKPLSAESIQRISNELCDLECSLKCASFIQAVTLGDFRLINAHLTKIEDFCRHRKTSEISLTIAKEAAKELPSLEDVNMETLAETGKSSASGPLKAVK